MTQILITARLQLAQHRFTETALTSRKSAAQAARHFRVNAAAPQKALDGPQSAPLQPELHAELPATLIRDEAGLQVTSQTSETPAPTPAPGSPAPQLLWLESSGTGQSGQPSAVMVRAIVSSPYGLLTVAIDGHSSWTTVYPTDSAQLEVSSSGQASVHSDVRGLQINQRQMAAALFSCRRRLLSDLEAQTEKVSGDHPVEDRVLAQQTYTAACAEALERVGETLTRLHDLDRPAISPELQAQVRLSERQLRAAARSLPRCPRSAVLIDEPQADLDGELGLHYVLQGGYQVVEIMATEKLIKAVMYPAASCQRTDLTPGRPVECSEKGLFISAKQARALLFMERDRLRDQDNQARGRRCSAVAGYLRELMERGVPGPISARAAHACAGVSTDPAASTLQQGERTKSSTGSAQGKTSQKAAGMRQLPTGGTQITVAPELLPESPLMTSPAASEAVPARKSAETSSLFDSMITSMSQRSDERVKALTRPGAEPVRSLQR